MVQLSFDIEEFDLPEEYGLRISPEAQIAYSEEGLNHILDILERRGVVATFYATVIFMEGISPATRQRLLAGGHEIASHGYSHSQHRRADYRLSRLRLEELTGRSVTGFRMPRMQAVDEGALLEAGYVYDASEHPTWLPGRYNHLGSPRRPHRSARGLLCLPASVTPRLRLPLFWLSLHHLPLPLYLWLASWTARHDDYLNIYLHPWEFIDLRATGLRLPWLVRRRSGAAMRTRLERLIRHLQARGERFTTHRDYLELRGAEIQEAARG